MTDEHDLPEQLRSRAAAGPSRGAATIWRDAARSTSGGFFNRRLVAAAAALIIVAAVSATVWLTNDNLDSPPTEVGPRVSVTTTTAAPTSPAAPEAPVRCDVAVLNASGQVGVAGRAADRIRSHLASSLPTESMPAVESFNAAAMTDQSAVLLASDADCIPFALSADLTEFAEPTLSPWPEALAGAVPPSLSTNTLIVVIGQDNPVVVVPSVVGLAVAEATQVLHEVGLVVSGVQGNPALPVLLSEPAPGHVVEPGTEVTLATELASEE